MQVDDEIPRHIVEYLQKFVGEKSGENIYASGKVLLIVLRDILDLGQERKIRQELAILRKRGNIQIPPGRKAADAIRLKDLVNVWKLVEQQKVKPELRQALEILTVAFATTSRVAEIITLQVGDVSVDGSMIAVRTKTQAATWERYSKHVANSEGLFPTQILARRRSEAILESRTLIFTAPDTEGLALSSAQVTKSLRKLMKTLHIQQRITAHSGRKGAAVSALLAGVPVAAIQALGAWKSADSMQAYLAKAVREEFSVLDLLKRPAGSQ